SECELRVQSGTRIIDFASVPLIPRFASSVPQGRANLGIGTLACASYLGEQSLRCDEIGRIQTLAEPTVDRRKHVSRGCAFSLTVQQLGQVPRRSQFPELCTLLARLGNARLQQRRCSLYILYAQARFEADDLGLAPLLAGPIDQFGSAIEQPRRGSLI